MKAAQMELEQFKETYLNAQGTPGLDDEELGKIPKTMEEAKQIIENEDLMSTNSEEEKT